MEFPTRRKFQLLQNRDAVAPVALRGHALLRNNLDVKEEDLSENRNISSDLGMGHHLHFGLFG